MLGRTTAEAYSSFIEPIQSALNTVSTGRLLLARRSSGIVPGEPLDIALNAGDPAPLRLSDSGQLFLRFSVRVRIEELDFGRYHYQCRQIAYWHTISDAEFREIVAFHWSSTLGGHERPFPHLHVGPLIASQSAFVPGRAHKLHLPTSQLSAQQIIRFAIEELGVRVRPGSDRSAVLAELNRVIGDA